MSFGAFYAWTIYALYLPFLMLGIIVAHYLLLRLFWRNEKRRGRRSGFSPSAGALGPGLLFVQAIFQPSVTYVLKEQQDEDADQDDRGDADTPQARLRHFHRQLARIRRGHPVDRLVLRI